MPRRSNGTNIDSNDSFIRVRSGYSNVYAVNAHLLSTEKEECDSKLSESDTLKMTQGRTYEDMSFLGVFFNFQYYLLLIPFKTVLETGTNQYRIQTHIVQKIFCLCIHTVVILIVTSLLILAVLRLTNNLEPKIVDIFTLVSILSTFVSFFLTIFMVWRRREEYLEVVENTRVNLKRAQKIKLLV
ncbi:unnamed protein product [Orchesella dallaii]|uniref:Uncharacterized protein n=1 Tax=Orchesella dallaii TaxID=48710 RepID=A0ABP1QKZ3_9HEXA